MTSHQPLRIIPKTELEFGECIGRGSRGSVFKAKWRLKAIWDGPNRAARIVTPKSSTDEQEAILSSDLTDRAGSHNSQGNNFGNSVNNPNMDNVNVKDGHVVGEELKVDVAVKQVMDNVENEAKLLNSLCHPNIIKFYGASTVLPDCYLVLELAAYGSLYNFLRKNELSYDRILLWATQIAEACRYLHEEPVNLIHRDLKSMNVLVCDNFIVKLCDFGSTHEYIRTTLMSFAGTASWMSPEVIRNEPISDRADVYSYGVVLWEMLTREIPFNSMAPMSVMWLVASQGKRLHIPSKCPKPFADLIESCWKEKPNDRFPMRTILDTLRKISKNSNLPKETQNFIGNKLEWQNEITNAMTVLKNLEGDLHKRENAVKKKEEELSRKERELQALQSKLETMSVHEEFRKRSSSGISQLPNWDERNVSDWLTAIQLGQYRELFQENNIDGEALGTIGDDDLKNLGVNSLGHRRKILESRAKLLYTLEYPTLSPSNSAAVLISPPLDSSSSMSLLSTTSLISNSAILSTPPSVSSNKNAGSSFNNDLAQSPSMKSQGIPVKITVHHHRSNATFRFIVDVLIEGDPSFFQATPILRKHHSGGSIPRNSGNNNNNNANGNNNNNVTTSLSMNSLNTLSNSNSSNSSSNNSSNNSSLTSVDNFAQFQSGKYFVERVVFHANGENSFGTMVIDPPFQYKVPSENKVGSEIKVVIDFDKKRFKKLTSEFRYKLVEDHGGKVFIVHLRLKRN